MEDAEQPPVLRHRQRRAAGAGDLLGDLAQVGRGWRRGLARYGAQDRIDRALLDQGVAELEARQAGLRGERR